MSKRTPQARPLSSGKLMNSFFHSKAVSPKKSDNFQHFYMSENPTPKDKKVSKKLVATPNLISINNGVLNQVYYIQPTVHKNSFDTNNQSWDTLDQMWDRSGLHQRKSSYAQNSNYHKLQEDQKYNSKAQNKLFQMLMSDTLSKTGESRRNSKTRQPTYQITTPQSRDKQMKIKSNQISNSFNQHLDTLNDKNRFNKSYISKRSQQLSTKNASCRQNGISFNQTVPHKRQTNNLFNASLGGQHTGVFFKNNTVKRGFQGDNSGYLQINSDTSKNILEETYSSGQVVKQIGLHNPKAIDLLMQGRNHIRDKQMVEAVNALRESVNLDPTLLESHYFLGIAYLGNVQFIKATQQFQSIVSQNPEFRKNVYLLLAICFKKVDELDQAIACLTKGINLFPRYYDALIYRGKIFIKQKQLDKALNDFQTAIHNCPQKGLGYLGKADCLRYKGNFQEAIQTYQLASQCEQNISQTAMLKKAVTLYEARRYQESIVDLNYLLESEPANSEASYFKGLCMLKLNSQEAILCFEQCIKHNNSKKAVTKSLLEIAKMKIQQRDFYAAYHTLNRAEFLDTEKTYLEKFRLFTEAVIFLMKRKFSESIQNFNSIQQNHSLNDFLRPLFYAYRAYGYFCLSDHANALNDYKKLIEYSGPSDQGALFNKLLCEGILQVQSQCHEKGLGYFANAGKIYPKKLEPKLYCGVTLINQVFNSNIKQNKDKIQLILQGIQIKKLKQGLQIIDQSIIQHESNANVYYIRAVIKAFLQNYGEAVQDIDKAIEKSEDNIPQYFFFRALIYGCSKQYKLAVSDFTICINLDESFADAYLQRAKCEFIYGDTTEAFADLQTFISLRPEDPSIHIWAGNFLFANAAVEDAVKAYSHAPDFQNDQQLLFLRSQCHLVLNGLQECLTDITRLFVLSRDRQYEFDEDCIQALLIVFGVGDHLDLQWKLSQTSLQMTQLTQNKFDGRLFKKHHLYIFRGVCQFHMHKYEDSLKDFKLAKGLKELQVTEKRLSRAGLENKHSLSDLFSGEHVVEISEEEEDADLLELLEIQFNELACLVILKQYNEAKESCQYLMDNINEAKKEGLEYLLTVVEKQIRKSEGKDKSRPNSVYDKIICLYDEPKENPICFQVPFVNINNLNNMKIRLSFSLPKVSPPSLIPTFDKKLVQSISPLWVENKPEAPWIRRNNQQGDMIIFTDNHSMLEDVRLETEDHEELEGKMSKQHSQIEPINRDAMKKNLMLDLDIEEKLKKLLGKKQNK